MPPNHPVTQHVRKVIERLLDANNLGTLKSARRPESTQAPGPESIWDVDSGFATGRTEEVNPGVGGSEWELMVVKDDKTVNAMASYGQVPSLWLFTYEASLFCTNRQYRGLYRYITCCKG